MLRSLNERLVRCRYRLKREDCRVREVALYTKKGRKTPKASLGYSAPFDAYLGEANYNATKAAKMAGYSEKSAYSIGSELTKKPHIRQAIDRHFKELTERHRREFKSRLQEQGW